MSQKESGWEKEFVEKGADIEHDRWARWQKYLHSKLKYFEFEHSQGGNKVAMYVLDPGDYERWSRQIDTPYSELSESEKESDRRETRNYLPLVSQILANREKEIAEEVEKAYKEKSSQLHGGYDDADYLNAYGMAIHDVLQLLKH